jgi:hypothetical protein
MGVVLSAYDPILDRKVAIKLVRPGVGAAGAHAARTARLLREAQAMAEITHKNVTTPCGDGSTRFRGHRTTVAARPRDINDDAMKSQIGNCTRWPSSIAMLASHGLYDCCVLVRHGRPMRDILPDGADLDGGPGRGLCRDRPTRLTQRRLYAYFADRTKSNHCSGAYRRRRCVLVGRVVTICDHCEHRRAACSRACRSTIRVARSRSRHHRAIDAGPRGMCTATAPTRTDQGALMSSSARTAPATGSSAR